MSQLPHLLAALEPVVNVLERLDVVYQLGGSVASSIHGVARATMDVDLVANLQPEHVPSFVKELRHDYYVEEQMIREALRERSCFNLVHQPTVLKIDIFVPKDRPYDAAALQRRRIDTLDDAPDARGFFVASPEDVILAKLEWYDRGGRVSERQWGDILGVMRVQGEALDHDYLLRWARDLGVADLLERAEAEQ
jgi:hypothetical protein